MVEGRVARALGDGDFTFRERHVLESGYTYLGIQTAHAHEGRFLFGIYGETGNPAGTLSCAADFSGLTRSAENGSYGLVDSDGWFGVAPVGSTSDGNTGKIAFRKRIVSEVVERVPMNAVDTRLFSDASAVAPLFRSTIANGTLLFLR